MQGVIRTEEKPYYTVSDVMDIFGICQDKARGMIRTVRNGLIGEGKLPEDYPRGKVPKEPFNKAYMIRR